VVDLLTGASLTTESYFWIISKVIIPKVRSSTWSLRANNIQKMLSANHISAFRANKIASSKHLFENLLARQWMHFYCGISDNTFRYLILKMQTSGISDLSDIWLERRKWKLDHGTEFYLGRSMVHRKTCSSAEPWIDLTKIPNFWSKNLSILDFDNF